MYSHIIIGDSHSDTQHTVERRHPLTDKVVTTAAAASEAQSLEAVEAAQAAFTEWSATPPAQRRDILNKAADIMEKRTEDFVEAMCAEVVCAPGWAHFNVFLTIQVLREAAGIPARMVGETIPSNQPGTLSMTVRQPVGVVFSMAPWNAPGVLGMRSLAYPLACGNTVVFKGSELSPRTHEILVEVLLEAGVPAGAVNYIVNRPEDAPTIVEKVIAHPAVRRVNFTGSSRVGAIIGEVAGRYLKPALLELGGKSPIVVLDDADIDKAVDAAVFGKFFFQGQICMSTERVILAEAIADEFIEKFAARVKELTHGNPTEDPSVDVGPVIVPAAGERNATLVKSAVDAGATLVCGGTIQGASVEPTILDGVTPEMDIYATETFAPITTIIRVDDDAEAVKTANDTAYGLVAAVHSGNAKRGLDVALQIQAGSVHINGATVANDANAPFGGLKDSGYGHFDGSKVIDEFTNLRWVTIEDPAQGYPL